MVAFVEKGIQTLSLDKVKGNWPAWSLLGERLCLFHLLLRSVISK